MKAKVSATLDEELLAFVDRLPGATRSEKLERALRSYRRAWDDAQLRRQLAETADDGDDAERAAWEATCAEAMFQP
jgi:metal-responsive CopG/Arc/MetJ family transcriptional regulator